VLPLRVLSLTLLCSALAQAAALNDSAPKFSLKNSHQEQRSLSEYKGKVVFINFWASWCAPCQQELPELNKLAAEFKGKKVQVLAINVDEDRAAAKKLLAKLGLSSSRMEILYDPKSKVVSAYNIDNMPTSFILDSKGIIRFLHAGYHPQDPASWRQEIDRLLQ
jgi:peroxiredoxin